MKKFLRNIDSTCMAAYAGAFIAIVIKVAVICYNAGIFERCI